MSRLNSCIDITSRTGKNIFRINKRTKHLKNRLSQEKSVYLKVPSFKQALKLISNNMGINPFMNGNVSSYFQLGFISVSDYTNFLQIGVFAGSLKLLSGIQVSLLNAARNPTLNSIQIGFINIAGDDSDKKDSVDIRNDSCGIQIGIGNLCSDKLDGGLQFGLWNSQFPYVGMGVNLIYLTKQSPAYAFIPEYLQKPIIEMTRRYISE